MDEPSKIYVNGWRWAVGLMLAFLGVVLATIIEKPVVLLVFLIALVLVYCSFHGLHFILSLPFRRRERARMFLELVEASVEHGHSVEQSIIRLSRSSEDSFGVRFHLLAGHLEQGLPLLAALEKVPRMLPPTVLAMLRVGAETGDIRRVLPSCRAHLRDAVPRVQKAQHYLVALVMVILPMQLLLYWMVRVVVFPKFQEIFNDMLAPGEFPTSSWAIVSVLDTAWPAFMALVGLPMLVGLVLYVLGPRPAYWLEWLAPRFGPPIARRLDWLATLADRGMLVLPWQRRRVERDFSVMLALLLDAGLPEEKAVLLAGESVANRAFLARARRVADELRRGMKLADALQFMDDAGELRWRMANAARASGHFRESLAGWLDTLDAKAFGQEQAVAHVITSACVLVNGCLLGLFTVSIFQCFVQLIDVASAW
ncbi:MAG: type II secretion system F family protein [Verrucomicrobia bacterium]|nr:type II secretion system F family protein [Verrucomicrobiota bacterium]